MAGEVNITVVGNLADDPELRYTQGGIAVCSVRVGSTPRVMNRTTNTWEDGETVWVRCTAWRELAENVAHFALEIERHHDRAKKSPSHLVLSKW